MGEAKSYIFAYYCSGHGYGHATRVVALTHELLKRGHRVHICTNAPEHVFNTTSSAGAAYRHAEIDAGIVQPKAYDVARRKTIQGLEGFLDKREERIGEEVEWLKEIRADAVLVDAPFLPCAAAQRAGIPSVIISNFTFDSCYSYLSVSTQADHAALRLSDVAQSLTLSDSSISSPSPSSSTNIPFPAIEEESEPPIPADYLAPLVKQAIQDYANASLLLRLPGAILIPAFDQDVPLPAPLWTDLKSHSFNSRIMDLLAREPSSIPCNGAASSSTEPANGAKRKRRVVDTPLITRPVSRDVYSKASRSSLLSSLGIPEEKHHAKILVVSFGGQSIPHPASRPPSPHAERDTAHHPTAANQVHQVNGALSPPPSATSNGMQAASMQRVVTQNHMYLPGAPPTLHQIDSSNNKRQSASTSRSGADPASSSKNHRRRISIELQPTFSPATSPVLDTEFDMDESNLLPPGWIAVVCGLSSKNLQEELPPDFYAAPRDIYVPDLTATCDVLLGKLGYGTCSETVATQTPFVYVPRPLFVEEFGLKRLMEQRGTALPMTRADFEAGRWSKLVLQAYEMGKQRKEEHREAHLARLSSGKEEESAGAVISLELEKFMREYSSCDLR